MKFVSSVYILQEIKKKIEVCNLPKNEEDKTIRGYLYQ